VRWPQLSRMSIVLVDLVGSPWGPTRATFLALSSSVPASFCCLSLPDLVLGPCLRGLPALAMCFSVDSTCCIAPSYRHNTYLCRENNQINGKTKSSDASSFIFPLEHIHLGKDRHQRNERCDAPLHTRAYVFFRISGSQRQNNQPH